MSLSLDGDTKATLVGKIVTASATAAGAPSATGVSVLHTGVASAFQIHKVRVGYTAMTAAAATQAIDLWTLPAGFVLQRVICKTNTVWAGTAITDVDVEVGITGGDVDAFMKSVDIDTAATVGGDVIAEVGVNLVDATRADVTVSSNAFATQVVSALFTAAGANVNAMTAGSTDFYLIGYQLPTD